MCLNKWLSILAILLYVQAIPTLAQDCPSTAKSPVDYQDHSASRGITNGPRKLFYDN
jgi:hypothetical protein